jgi:NADPH-dependent 2,4-dienoyl-CoA reductase/sulfur reductase-like enzyme
MTAHAVREGIREIDAKGSIGMFCREPWPPYARPPLSKGLWNGTSIDDIWLNGDDGGTELHVGESIAAIDVHNRRLRNTEGESYGYKKLMLATGSHVRHLPFEDEGVLYFRSLDSYHTLRSWTGEGKKFLIVGGGFIGSEIAAALSSCGEQVTMLFPERGIGARMFPEDLALFVSDQYRERGVDVQDGVRLEKLRQKDGRYIAESSVGRSYEADHVVAGIGVQPDTTLAEAAGLMVDNGVVVDEYLRSTNADVYAAGDVASVHSPAHGMRRRVEHEDNAMTMGKQAGRNMALHLARRDAAPWTHLPMFYSDLFDLGYEAVGTTSTDLETVSVWKEPYREGVVYYLEDDRIRGVLLWNVWERVDEARALIAHPGPFTAEGIRAQPPITL